MTTPAGLGGLLGKSYLYSGGWKDVGNMASWGGGGGLSLEWSGWVSCVCISLTTNAHGVVLLQDEDARRVLGRWIGWWVGGKGRKGTKIIIV